MLEPLEPRALLSAPTATIDPPTTNTTNWQVVVHYHSDRSINLSTIGNDDLMATGPGGYNHAGRLVSRTADSSTSARAVYAFDAPTGAWDWTQSGEYTVRLRSGTVRNSRAQSNSAATLGSFQLNFTALHLSFGTQNVDQGSQTWILTATVTSPAPQVFSGADAYARITGPHGLNTVVMLNYSPGYGYGYGVYENGVVPPTTQATLAGSMAAPGGAWDYSDSGRYTVQIGLLANPAQGMLSALLPPTISRSYNLSFTAPKAEVVSSRVETHDWLVTVRYSHSSGINTATIGTGDATADFAGWPTDAIDPGFDSGPTPGSLVQMTRARDGSVTAVYRFAAPSDAGWSYRNTGEAMLYLNPDAVRSKSGAPVGAAVYLDTTITFAAPAPTGIRTISANAAAWDVELTFSDLGKVIDTSSLRTGNLQAFGPLGGERVSLISVDDSSDTVLKVHYRVIPYQSTTLRAGTYAFSLAEPLPGVIGASSAVTYSDGRVIATGYTHEGVPTGFIGNLTLRL